MKFLLVLSAALAAAYGEASEPRAQLRPITTYYKPELFGNYVPTFLLPTSIVQQYNILPLYPLGVPSDPTLRPPVKGVVRGPRPWGQPSITVPEYGTETIIGQLAPTEQGTLSPENIIAQVAPAMVGFGKLTEQSNKKGVVRGIPKLPATTDDFQAWESRPPPEDSFGKLTEQSNKKGVVRGIPKLPATTDDHDYDYDHDYDQVWESRPPPEDSFERDGDGFTTQSNKKVDRLTEQSNKKGVVRGTRPLSPLPVQGVQIVTKVPATSTVCLNYMGAAVPCANGMPMPVDQPSKLGVVRRPLDTQDFSDENQAQPRPPPPKNHDLTFGSEGPAIGSGAVITGDIFGGGVKREEYE